MNEHKYENWVQTKKTSIITENNISVKRAEITNTIKKLESGKSITEGQIDILKVNILEKIEQLNKLISLLSRRVTNLEKILP